MTSSSNNVADSQAKIVADGPTNTGSKHVVQGMVNKANTTKTLVSTFNPFEVLSGEKNHSDDLTNIAAGLRPSSDVNEDEDEEIEEVYNETMDFIISGSPNKNKGASTPYQTVFNG
jgi:hypothetical protein